MLKTVEKAVKETEINRKITNRFSIQSTKIIRINLKTLVKTMKEEVRVIERC